MIMPYNASKYSGIDYFFRSQAAALCCMGVTTLFAYPFDLLHTRLAADCTPASRQRIYSSTFQCFNRTNIEEGRWGMYRGLDFALFSAAIRAALQLPVYDLVKKGANQAGIYNTDSQLGQFT